MGKVEELKLGMNGLGRIGKLTLWNHVAKKYFKEIVINIGREAGTSLNDIAHYIARDSTYGTLSMYLYGSKTCKDVICDVNASNGTMTIDGVKITVLRKSRNPKELDWKHHNVALVVDTTGAFLDPTRSADESKGALRGHLDAVHRIVLVKE